jgi:diaminopimelate epimerase
MRATQVAARKIPFVKAHGLGNDFLILDQAHCSGLAPGDLALRLCDRHAGVGADGIVILSPPSGEAVSFRIFNSDGSEATLSGNALRCAAAVRAWQGGPGQKEFHFETRAGRRSLTYLSHGGGAWIFRAEMGRPGFAAAAIPFRPPQTVAEPIIGYPLPAGDATVAATILHMGNPQCIVFLDDWEDFDWRALGADLERHPYFPDRANIGFVKILSEDRIAARFWERGAGYTQASGTGSCACAVAAHLNGRTRRRVTVQLERGPMEVLWREDDCVELTGPAEIAAQGEFFWNQGENQ